MSITRGHACDGSRSTTWPVAERSLPHPRGARHRGRSGRRRHRLSRSHRHRDDVLRRARPRELDVPPKPDHAETTVAPDHVEIFDALERQPLPVVAAINGPALGRAWNLPCLGPPHRRSPCGPRCASRAPGLGLLAPRARATDQRAPVRDGGTPVPRGRHPERASRVRARPRQPNRRARRVTGRCTGDRNPDRRAGAGGGEGEPPGPARAAGLSRGARGRRSRAAPPRSS